MPARALTFLCGMGSRNRREIWRSKDQIVETGSCYEAQRSREFVCQWNKENGVDFVDRNQCQLEGPGDLSPKQEAVGRIEGQPAPLVGWITGCASVSEKLAEVVQVAKRLSIARKMR